MNSEKITESWKKNYTLLKIYYDHYGNIEVPSKFKTLNGYEYDENGICLGNWVLAQRQAYNKINTSRINQEQIELLDLLEMRWNHLNKMDKWNKYYNLAKRYYEYYGNLEVPVEFKTLNGYNYDERGVKLGSWVMAQKQKSKKETKLTQEQIDQLNQIGIVWNNTRVVRPWLENYALAQKYYQYYQNLNVPREFKTINGYIYDKNGINLGTWVATQRQFYKDGKLTQEQIDQLNQIEIIWERMDIWLKKYNLAKIYYEHYGNLEIPTKFKTLNGYEYDEKGVRLGTWITLQRQAYNKIGTVKITSQQVQLLNQIGMRWNNIYTVLPWEEYYVLAQKYYQYHQNLNIPKPFKTLNGYEYDEKGMQLGIWLANQRKYYKNKIGISDERIKLLNQIHIDWETNDLKITWMKYYTLVKIYYEYYGDSNIPASFKTLNGYEYDENGVSLGRWLGNQRQAYKGIGSFELSEEKIKLLQDIKIRWFTPCNEKKLQEEKINAKNRIQKQIEILNRVRSIFIQYDLDQLPSKEEINKKILKSLNKI